MKPIEFLNNVVFEKIETLHNADLEKILEIRNQENVRKAMINDEIINLEDHISWFKLNISNKKKIFYKINFFNKIIGLITLNTNETENCSWAFYLSENAQKGFGALIELKFLDHYFFQLKKDNLECQVLSFNKSVLKLHQKFGFKIINVKKNVLKRFNKKHDLIKFSLNSDTWKIKQIILKKRLKIFN